MHNDPNREVHDAIFKSFLAYPDRRQTAPNSFIQRCQEFDKNAITYVQSTDRGYVCTTILIAKPTMHFQIFHELRRQTPDSTKLDVPYSEVQEFDNNAITHVQGTTGGYVDFWARNDLFKAFKASFDNNDAITHVTGPCRRVREFLGEKLPLRGC